MPAWEHASSGGGRDDLLSSRSHRQDHRANGVPLTRVIQGQSRSPPGTRTRRPAPMTALRGTPSKLVMRVRFPEPAPPHKPRSEPCLGHCHLPVGSPRRARATPVPTDTPRMLAWDACQLRPIPRQAPAPGLLEELAHASRRQRRRRQISRAHSPSPSAIRPVGAKPRLRYRRCERSLSS